MKLACVARNSLLLHRSEFVLIGANDAKRHPHQLVASCSLMKRDAFCAPLSIVRHSAMAQKFLNPPEKNVELHCFSKIVNLRAIFHDPDIIIYSFPKILKMAETGQMATSEKRYFITFLPKDEQDEPAYNVILRSLRHSNTCGVIKLSSHMPADWELFTLQPSNNIAEGSAAILHTLGRSNIKRRTDLLIGVISVGGLHFIFQ